MGKSRLAAQIKKMPESGDSRHLHSLHTLQERDPTLYEELIEVIDDFNAFGHTRRVFPTIAALWRYLSGNDPERKIEPIIGVQDCQFRRFVKDRHAATQKK